VVPKVKGKKLGAAKGAITAAHCSVGKIGKAFSAKIKRGTVISQSPKPGTSGAAGAKVKLMVSKGPKPKH
jgi:beta-lactam-binding protein with PASTA domain